MSDKGNYRYDWDEWDYWNHRNKYSSKGDSKGKNGNDTLVGGQGNDYLDGKNGNDVLFGNGGNDRLDGGEGNDTLYGGTGNDELNGGSGNDLLVAEEGFDELEGDSGNDTLIGGSSTDFLNGGSHDDRLVGGGGNDYIDGDSGTDTAVFSGSISDYRFFGDHGCKLDDWLIVRDTRGGSPDGTDLLHDVEVLQFSDGVIYLDGRNNAPIAADDTATTLEDKSVTISLKTLLANDDDFDGDRLSVVSVSGAVHGTVKLDGKGNAIFTPDADFNGAASFTYKVSDGHGGFDEGTVRVDVKPVNDGPVARADSYSTGEDDVLTVPAPGVLANDTDVDGDVLSVANAGTITSTLGATVVLNADGSFSYDASSSAALQALNTGQSADDKFSYQVSDGHGGSAIQTVTISVAGANEGAAPVAGDDAATTPEDTPVFVSFASLLANDSDADGDILSVTGVANAVNGTAVLVDTDADGAADAVRFDADADYFGPASFEYTVSDGSQSDTGLVNVTVTPENDAPVAADDGPFEVDEDTTITISFADLLANDTDVDGDSLSVTGLVVNLGTPLPVDTNGDGVPDTIIFIPNGLPNSNNGNAFLVDTDSDGVNDAVQFTPLANLSGSASFDYVVSDGLQSDVGRVEIAVTPVNDGPVAVNDDVVTDEDTPVTIAAADLLANDTDADFGDTKTVVSVQGAVNGTVELVGGDIVFTPAPDYSISSIGSTAGFSYTMEDGAGAQSSAFVFVTVFPVNDAPVAVDDSYDTSEDTPLLITAGNLLANDTDVDADDTRTLVSVQGAVNGTVILDGDEVTFTPDADYNGPASFTYTIRDSAGAESTAAVHVTVAAVNDAPVLGGDLYFTTEDEALAIGAPGVLANDSDPEGDALFVSDTDPFFSLLGAAVQLNADGSFSYDPTTSSFLQDQEDGEFIPDEFTYQVSDGNGGFATAIVTVVVNGLDDGPNTQPVAVDDSFEISGVVTDDLVANAGNVLVNDSDAQDEVTAVPQTWETHYGTLQLEEDGELNLFLTPEGADDIRRLQVGDNPVITTDTDGNPLIYLASDGTETDDAFITVTIAGENDAPVLPEEEFQEATRGSNLVLDDFISSRAFDWDDEVGTLVLDSIGADEGTVVFDESTGQVTYTPSEDSSGADTIFYTIADPHGGVSAASIFVTVEDPGLFTGGDDNVNFDLVTAGSYADGSQYDAGAGNDFVQMPSSAASASAAGFDPATLFQLGAGGDIALFLPGADRPAFTVSGGEGSDFYIYAGLGSAADTVTDFVTGVGGDAIFVSGFLQGYDPLAASDFFQVLDDGSNTTIAVDTDGAGSMASLAPLVTLQGVTGVSLDDLLQSGNLIAA